MLTVKTNKSEGDHLIYTKVCLLTPLIIRRSKSRGQCMENGNNDLNALEKFKNRSRRLLF